jgi:hypothetical protein
MKNRIIAQVDSYRRKHNNWGKYKMEVLINKLISQN